MPSPLSFKLKVLFNLESIDAAGNWTYVGADAVEEGTGKRARLIATKRDNSHGNFKFPASMLTATVMFAAPGDDLPQSLTLQGLHDLQSNNESGSVSAASAGFSAYVGAPFTFDAKHLLLTITPAG